MVPGQSLNPSTVHASLREYSLRIDWVQALEISFCNCALGASEAFSYGCTRACEAFMEEFEVVIATE